MALKEKVENLNNTKDTTSEFDQKDIEENKAIALLSYLGILFLIPLLGRKDSKFCKFHAGQGISLFICELIVSIVFGVLTRVFSGIYILWLIFDIAQYVAYILCLVCVILGIVNVVNGKAKELPVIGQFKILK